MSTAQYIGLLASVIVPLVGFAIYQEKRFARIEHAIEEIRKQNIGTV